MIYIIITLIILLIASGYVIYNLFNKVEVLETLAEQHSDYLVRLNDMVEISTKRLKEIDDKGAFSSDDEIGWFFTYVDQVQSLLKQYVTENVVDLNDKKT
jgi:hypothetical protein|tara:strand:+ start:788 stop:1087 length:300 start_codon:yes stop_codon:yes gene_type:complete